MTARRVTLTPDDHIAGSPSAPVLLVEYGDFQCPYCGQAAAQVERLQKRLGDRVAFVFRHFPLTQAHPYARSRPRHCSTPSPAAPSPHPELEPRHLHVTRPGGLGRAQRV
jgi:hypothetical protein